MDFNMKDLDTAKIQYIKPFPPESQIEKILHKIIKPTYVLEAAKLRYNLEILDYVQKNSGAKILLALKGFAFWSPGPRCTPACLRQPDAGRSSRRYWSCRNRSGRRRGLSVCVP